MFGQKKVSVVIPAYNESEGIAEVVHDFKKQPQVDEVVVIDNNSIDATAQLASHAGARVVKETKQGYGFACKRGLDEAKGDIVILTEADSTFEARDVQKLLVYIDDADLILGTRTTNELIHEGANMGPFLKWGNTFIAKIIQVLWFGKVRLTDVGCTYRAIRKTAYLKIEKQLSKCGDSTFSPFMITEALKNGIKIVEIPVNYTKRKGVSKITGKKFKAFKLGLRMIFLILKKRIF